MVDSSKLILAGQARRVPGGVLHPASTTADGQVVLFSLTTITREQPPVQDGDCGDALVLHEDAWRQCEFFPEQGAAQVLEMVAFLRDHEPHMGDGAGFREIYIRDEEPTSVAQLSLSLAKLSAALPCATRRRGFALRTAAGDPWLVAGGFAFSLPGGGDVYGRADGDRIVSLSLALTHGQQQPTPEAVGQLAAYARAHHLLVVDWLVLVALRPEPAATVWQWPLLPIEPPPSPLSSPPRESERPWWRFW